jgi:hypothetical protein
MNVLNATELHLRMVHCRLCELYLNKKIYKKKMETARAKLGIYTAHEQQPWSRA